MSTSACPSCNRPLPDGLERGITTPYFLVNTTCSPCRAKALIAGQVFWGGREWTWPDPAHQGTVLASPRALDALGGRPVAEPAARDLLAKHLGGLGQPDGRGGLVSRHIGRRGATIEILTLDPALNAPGHPALIYSPDDSSPGGLGSATRTSVI